MSIDEIKLRYDFINKELNTLESELKSISITTFELNPHITELTEKIKGLKDERQSLFEKIKENGVEDN
jgi:uncharacterized coiled-coil DUF342 family protein